MGWFDAEELIIEDFGVSPDSHRTNPKNRRKERLEKAHEGKKLKGQQGLTSAVCTSKRLRQFE